MTLKKILLGTALMSAGLGGAYANWKYFPQDTPIGRDLGRPLMTLIIGIGSLYSANKIWKSKDYSSNTNPPSSSDPNPNFPRKRKYIETRTDEYGRQYRIEREETIE